MKKILTTSIILTSFLSAYSTDYLEYQINQLQKEIKTLKTQVKKPEKKQSNSEIDKLKAEIKKLKAKVDDNEAYTEDVESSLDSLTAKVLKNNRVGFTRLKFDSTMHNFHYKSANGGSYLNTNVDTINLKLDLEKIISPNLTFRGQLAMYKYWAQGAYYPYSNYDNMQGRVPSDTSLYVTRAYIDWKVAEGKIPTTLTIGRQPSSSGPSWQYSNNGVRYGTYDALVFDGNADGIVATMSLNKVTPLKNSALRLAYGKGYQNNSFDTQNNGLDDTNVYGLFFESAIPSIKNSFMQFYYSKANDVNNMQNQTIGDITWFGGMFELNNINHFDFFAHFSISKAKPNGQLAIIDDQNHTAGLLTNTAGDTDTKIGRAVWIGTRYSFNSKAKIGLEYGRGSKNWINMTQGSDNILNPRSTRGNVLDVYGIFPIDKTIGVNAFIKVGTTRIDYKYSNSGTPFGAPTKIDSTMQNAANTIDSINDFYINFQVNY